VGWKLIGVAFQQITWDWKGWISYCIDDFCGSFGLNKWIKTLEAYLIHISTRIFSFFKNI
jgi:hypothetical protein